MKQSNLSSRLDQTEIPGTLEALLLAIIGRINVI